MRSKSLIVGSCLLALAVAGSACSSSASARERIGEPHPDCETILTVYKGDFSDNPYSSAMAPSAGYGEGGFAQACWIDSENNPSDVGLKALQKAVSSGALSADTAERMKMAPVFSYSGELCLDVPPSLGNPEDGLGALEDPRAVPEKNRCLGDAAYE